MARSEDWTKLGYQYDDLQPQADAVNPDGTLNEDKYKQDLQAYLNETYPDTAHLVRKIRTDENIAVPRGIPEKVGKPFDDYIINVIYDRYALGTSYYIKFYLGGPEDKEETNYVGKNYIGQIYTFSRRIPTETTSGCGNCKKQADLGVLSQAQIPITTHLINHVFDTHEDHSLKNFEHVEDYLRLHLNWKFFRYGGDEVDASKFPKTKISVMRGTVKPQSVQATPTGAAGSAPDSEPKEIIMPPTYHSYQPLYEATEGKNWGLSRDEA